MHPSVHPNIPMRRVPVSPNIVQNICIAVSRAFIPFEAVKVNPPPTNTWNTTLTRARCPADYVVLSVMIVPGAIVAMWSIQ